MQKVNIFLLYLFYYFNYIKNRMRSNLKILFETCCFGNSLGSKNLICFKRPKKLKYIITTNMSISRIINKQKSIIAKQY